MNTGSTRSSAGSSANIDVIPPLIVRPFQCQSDVLVSDNKAVVYVDRKKSLCGNAPEKVYTAGGTRTITFEVKL